ncbi:replication initiation protein RepC [Paracoccus homiensis]|uniref:replication initiation protein RepC n=1 Tax=Paracoccus homiensis TaxID=364199 RepID=UPI000B807B74
MPLPLIPIGLVLSVCREIQAYADEKVHHWHHLVRAAELVRSIIGISESARSEAMAAMGPVHALVARWCWL